MYSGRRHDAACMRLAHAEDLLLQVLLISHTFLSLYLYLYYIYIYIFYYAFSANDF